MRLLIMTKKAIVNLPEYTDVQVRNLLNKELWKKFKHAVDSGSKPELTDEKGERKTRTPSKNWDSFPSGTDNYCGIDNQIISAIRVNKLEKSCSLVPTYYAQVIYKTNL